MALPDLQHWVSVGMHRGGEVGNPRRWVRKGQGVRKAGGNGGSAWSEQCAV
jgi:hypothetical protein